MPLQPANQPQLIRSIQKDDYYQNCLRNNANEAFQTLAGFQTLGEEYVNILQVDPTKRKVPSRARRGALICLHVFVPYLLDKMLVRLEHELQAETVGPRAPQTRDWNLTSFFRERAQWAVGRLTETQRRTLLHGTYVLRQGVTFAHRLHVALFYINGAFYHLGKRVSGISYLRVRGLPGDDRAVRTSYKLLESRREQQSNLQYSPCKLKLDSIKCKNTSSAIASDLILKQRNLNSRAEMPLHYPQGTGGSKTPKKPYQDNVRNASCIRSDAVVEALVRVEAAQDKEECTKTTDLGPRLHGKQSEKKGLYSLDSDDVQKLPCPHFLTLVFLLLECEKNQDDCWAVGLHQRRACRGVDELSKDLVLQRALLKWKGERYKLQLARAREQHRLRQILNGWHRWAEQSLEGKVQRFGARLEQDLSRTVALPFIDESSISSGFHSNSPVCLSLDVSCSSAEQADQEASYERTDLKACRMVSRGDVMKREPQVDLSESSLEQEECEPPLRTSSRLHSPQHGMMHPSLSVSFYQWMEYAVMRRAERLLIGDFKERKNQSVMIWAFETWSEKKRSMVKARKHQKKNLKVIRLRASQLYRTERMGDWLQRKLERQRVQQGFALWAAQAWQAHNVKLYHRNTQLTSEKYLKKWRCAVLLKRFQRTQSSQRTERTWDQWRSLTGAVLFINNMCERRLLEKAWMRWRKRRIQAKVSQAFSAQQHMALLSESLDYDRCINEPFMEVLDGMDNKKARKYEVVKWIVVFAIGACTGLPVAAGSGIPEIKCYLNGVKIPGIVRLRTFVCKAVGVLFTVAGGLFVGKEGPMIHSGAIVGAGLPQFQSITFKKIRFNFPYFRTDRDKRDFVSAGAAAGVAAAFGAPIGGTLFSLEEGSSFWNQELTWKVLFCSMSATFTLNFFRSGILYNSWGSFQLPGLLNFGEFKCSDSDKKCHLWTAVDLAFFVVMGIFGGLLGALFNCLNKRLAKYRMRNVHPKAKFVRVLESLLVTMVTTIVLFVASMTLGECRDLSSPTNTDNATHVSNSEDVNSTIKTFFCPNKTYNDMATLFFNPQEVAIHQLFHQDSTFSPVSLSIFFVLYFLLACWTYGISVPSGLFVPSLLCGAAYGRLVANILKTYIGMDHVYSGTFALVGAASFLGGVVRMTISLTVILIESTNEITYGLPIMITLMKSSILTRAGEQRRRSQSMKSYPSSELRNVCDELAGTEQAEEAEDMLQQMLERRHVPYPNLYPDQSPSEEWTMEERFRPLTFHGLILRSQLVNLLIRGVCYAENQSSATQPRLSYTEMTEDYPRYPDIHDLDLALLNPRMIVDVAPYMNPCPYTVSPNTRVSQVFNLFRTMGLRHLPVVNAVGEVRGYSLPSLDHDARLLQNKKHWCRVIALIRYVASCMCVTHTLEMLKVHNVYFFINPLQSIY
ncbi:UNVERIFIED_CONTAM: hypothetical protein FKN15_075695 [Acipenser sinensis]